jgi:uncharacterized protein YkwD
MNCHFTVLARAHTLATTESNLINFDFPLKFRLQETSSTGEFSMGTSQHWRLTIAGLLTTVSLLGCGGGGSDAPATATNAAAQEPGAPALVNNVAIDGRNWINYRRSQIGVPVLAQNTVIDRAAQSHSDYQKLNDTISHDQIEGKPGFTGQTLLERLNAASYDLGPSYAIGEVISATTTGTGFFMAEELITAIYHRFVMFEPRFKEIGTGSASAGPGAYTYFTADFAAANGFGTGLGSGAIVSWPFNGQTMVATNFFSNNESPDPVANVNEVGYPVSVHADIDVALTVQSFTIRPRGGADLAVKLLAKGSDPHTPDSAAAIIPLSALKAGTVYDVAFTGTANGAPISKSWSFTTK